MLKKKDRVIIDTNLWVSFLLTNDFTKLDKIFKEQLIILLFSRELLEEFVEVIQRPKFKKYLNSSALDSLLIRIMDEAVFIEVESQVKVCRDPKDDFLLSLAKEGKATHLITGDKDLLEIRIFGKTKITTMSDFLLKK